jgi:hypothetical protein
MLLAFFAAGCSTDSDAVQAGNVLWDYISGNSQKISLEQAAAIPYATMGMAYGSGPQALLVLGAATPDEADWYGGERLFVATRRGQVIRTVGMPYDLGGIHAALDGPQGAPPQSPVDLQPSRMLFDFPDLGVFSAVADCSRTDRGDDNIEILGTQIPTRHIVEHCDVPVLNWKFNNEFWVDATTHYVWRSSQYIHPKSAPIVLEVLRPEQTSPG